MAQAFNAEEVFGIAVQIERNGAAFYKAAAESLGDEGQKKLLQGLAEWELKHEDTFARMAEQLRDDRPEFAAYDPEYEASRYLEAFASGKVFDLNADPAAFLKTSRGMAAILRKAIELEKDSIVFYTAIESSMPADRGRERVREIIGQEMDHVLILTDELAKVDTQ